MTVIQESQGSPVYLNKEMYNRKKLKEFIEVLIENNALDNARINRYESDEELVDFLFSLLTNRERNILAKIYGLTDGIEKSHEEIAEEYKVTSVRIRQIEQKAFRKMRFPIKKQA